MDSKKNIKKEVESVLKGLHQKIDFLKEKVEKLCDTTGCFEHPDSEISKKKKK